MKLFVPSIILILLIGCNNTPSGSNQESAKVDLSLEFKTIPDNPIILDSLIQSEGGDTTLYFQYYIHQNDTAIHGIYIDNRNGYRVTADFENGFPSGKTSILKDTGVPVITANFKDSLSVEEIKFLLFELEVIRETRDDTTGIIGVLNEFIDGNPFFIDSLYMVGFQDGYYTSFYDNGKPSYKSLYTSPGMSEFVVYTIRYDSLGNITDTIFETNYPTPVRVNYSEVSKK